MKKETPAGKEMQEKGLDRTQIKYIAIAAMIIDHIGMFFLSPGISEAALPKVAAYAAMRTIGRLTGPIMLFFLTEGFMHTSSRPRYFARLLSFGLISQIPYSLAHYDRLFVADDLNVIITLAAAFLMLEAAERIENRALGTAAVFAIIVATFCCDWGVIGPFMAWLFYTFREDRKLQMRSYAILCAVQVVSAAVFLRNNGLHWYGELWQAGMFLVIPVLLTYNGEPGKKTAFNKWMFYVIYPLHLMVIWLIEHAV